MDAKLCIATLACIDSVSERDFTGVLTILQSALFRSRGAVVPIWDSKLKKIVRKPVQALAGLLCYTDPKAQTKGQEIGDFLTEETRQVLINAVVVATDMQKPGTMKLA